MQVGKWVKQTAATLREAGIESAQLDAELLACSNYHVVEALRDKTRLKNREDVLAHPEREIPDQRLDKLAKFVTRRAQHEPMAYLVHYKEFYGHRFYVNHNVLIPRPETEQLIDIAKQLKPENILDVGTGSGCIATTLRQELPDAKITASDISQEALGVAILNSRHAPGNEKILHGNMYSAWVKQNDQNQTLGSKILPFHGIDFVQADLLDGIDDKFDLIVANLPYLDATDPTWERSKELEFEPAKALFAARGTSLMRKLIRQAPKNLLESGYLLMEMDSRQLDTMAKFAQKHGFAEVERHPFALLLQRT